MTTTALAPSTESRAPVAVAGELLAHTRAELPTLADRAEREQLLTAPWLVSFRSTRRACSGDLATSPA